jgi:rSAM/selenodomain-associated transferase 1
MAVSSSERVILFLKSFQAGHVKTRLAARLGDFGALSVYTAMVAELLAKLEPMRQILVPYFDTLPDPDGEPAAVSSLLSRGCLKIQRGQNLGERMANAFREVYAGGVDRAVLIGSDIPQIDGPLLEGCLEALRTSPMVVGPAVDGGYYLIGFQRRRFDAALFRGIEWSTGRVLEQTLAKTRALGLSCHIGPELQDVDTIEDLESLSIGGLTTGSPNGFLAQVLERYLVRTGD